jgi:hypothetical protein
LTQNAAKTNFSPEILGGDLSGTITNSKVVGMAGIPIQAGSPSDQNLIKYNSSANQWQYGGQTLSSPDVQSINVLNSSSPVTYFDYNPHGGFSAYILQSTDNVLMADPSFTTGNLVLPATSTVGRIIYVFSYYGGSSDSGLNIGVPYGNLFNNQNNSSGTPPYLITNPNINLMMCYDGINWMGVGSYI